MALSDGQNDLRDDPPPPTSALVKLVEGIPVDDKRTASTWHPRGFGGSLQVIAPAGAAVSVKAVSPVGGMPENLVAVVGSSRSSSLRKRIVSFVFDRTRKHGRFMVGAGGRGTRRVVERATV